MGLKGTKDTSVIGPGVIGPMPTDSTTVAQAQPPALEHPETRVLEPLENPFGPKVLPM